MSPTSFQASYKARALLPNTNRFRAIGPNLESSSQQLFSYFQSAGRQNNLIDFCRHLVFHVRLRFELVAQTGPEFLSLELTMGLGFVLAI